MKLELMFVASLCVVAAGCAGDGANERRPVSDNDYVTGSRIPQKDRAGVATMTPEGFERAAEHASMPKKERSGGL